MIRGVVLVALVGTCFGSITTFNWDDCDSDPNRNIKIGSISVSPMPLVLPGPLTFSVKGNVTRDLIGGKIDLNLRRHLPILGYTHIPCILGVGSCQVAICGAVESLVKESDATLHKLGTDIQKIFTDNHIGTICPLHAQAASVPSTTVQLPDPGTVASVLAAGDYDITATIRDNSGAIQGCLHFKVELKRKSGGFLFG